LHQGERPKLPTCAMKSRRLQKAWKGNLGSAKRPLSRFWLSLRVDFPIIRYFELYRAADLQLNIAAAGSEFYNATMLNNSEVVILANGSSGSVIAAPEPTPQFIVNACCLWCDQTFMPRTTGGSAQRFCSTAHRQQFWIAARRWTMRAIEVGLLSVDCLKASHTSVHAA
jgi:hypothetical protein